MNTRAIRRLLLDLAGTVRPIESASLSVVSDDDWTTLDDLAGQHRLCPLLYAIHRAQPAVPPRVLESWHHEYRASALQSLVIRADLAECCRLLEQRGFAPIALKGAYLAWHAYPEAAQRPLRDIDLLLTADTVADAHAALLSEGYSQPEPPEMAIADYVRMDKHLPPLIAPRGTAIEIHHRLSMPHGALDHFTPAGDEAGVRQRAIRVDGLSFPCPEDMLVHLIVHAVHGHRLDCGPLVLTDIRHLVSAHAIDGDRFSARARAEGWLGGAQLLFRLVRQYHGADCPLPDLGEQPALPDDLVDVARDLLLQDQDTRQSAAAGAALLAATPRAMLRRVTAGREASGQTPIRRDLSAQGGYLQWAATRIQRTIGDLSEAKVRQQSRDLARLSRWLGN